MLPRILLLAISLSSLAVTSLGAAPGKAARKDAKEAAAEAAKPKTPAKPIAPAAAVPVVPPANAVWRVWKDNQGRTVEAMFCGLSGEFITLQTKDGKTYHFNGNVLCPEDIAFAKECATKSRASGFSGLSVAQAAADIDRLVGAALAAKGVPERVADDGEREAGDDRVEQVGTLVGHPAHQRPRHPRHR